MRITKIGSDLISINEKNYKREKFQNINRVHLIKFDFEKPTYDLIKESLSIFPRTNRFIIENNIREYNSILRMTEKKYYVMNSKEIDIISFFRKNNKILVNFSNLGKEERNFFLLEGIFDDILRNTEVIAINKKIYDEKMEILDKWKGNVVILNNNENI